jgi:hypothetical protein
VGIISAKTAFAAYIVLALLAVFTLDGDSRKTALAVLALFAVKTYVDIVRRRIADREAEEAASTAAAPAGDVSTRSDS